MSDRFEFSSELKSELFKAQSADEVAKLLQASGQEAAPEEASELWKEIESHKTCSELSLEELEAVSGGEDRDWITDGCAATVEPGSWCGSNDSCHVWDITYDNPPKALCPKCGGGMTKSIDDNVVRYTCAVCGHVKEEKINNVGTGF